MANKRFMQYGFSVYSSRLHHKSKHLPVDYKVLWTKDVWTKLVKGYFSFIKQKFSKLT